MPTLQELFEDGEFGATTTKVASAQTADLDSMSQLAMQLGLLGDLGSEKTAAEEEKKEEEKEEKEEEGEKKASFGSLHSLLFPESPLASQEKTAAEKLAAEEEAFGAATYDMFTSAVDSFVEKLAYEALAGNPHGDSQAVNHLPNNKPADAKNAINTAPHITDEVKATNDARTVGHYEQKKTAAALAFQKHLLLAQLEG